MNEAEQAQNQVPHAVPFPARRSDEFERWRFDIDDLLLEKEYNLLGYFWDKDAEDGNGAWVEKGEARVNKIGAKAIITAMSGVINKVSTLTNLTIDEIFMEVKILAMNLNRLFFLHHEKYGLQSPSDAQDLLWQLVFFAFNGLKQSEGALAIKSIVESGQTIRHYYGEQKPSGFLHLPKLGKKD